MSENGRRTPIELQLAGAMTKLTVAKELVAKGQGGPEVDGHLARETNHGEAMQTLVNLLAQNNGSIDIFVALTDKNKV